jgi:serine/threonine-protein kinase
VLDDDATHDGIVFLVMELLEGTNLETLCRDARRDPNEVAFLVDGLLDILGAAHASWIVHRDVKPSNVFLTTKGDIRLLDFGIARLREASSAPSHTRNGAVLGTPGFMAPEQARGRSSEVDARTDIWAVGATMFRILTGRLVHEAATGQESMIAAATLPAPALKSARGDVPDSVAALVDRALRFEAGERWQDAMEMQKALRSIRTELPPYSWQGISLTDDVTGERTLDPSGETPTTSSFEESQGQALGLETVDGRFEVERGSRRHWVLVSIVVAVAASLLVIANLRVRFEAPRRQVPAAAPVRVEALHGPLNYGGATVEGMAAARTPATTDPAAAETTPSARPASNDRSSEPATPRRSGPTETSGRTPARPAPITSSAGPAPLDEFWNERR